MKYLLLTITLFFIVGCSGGEIPETVEVVDTASDTAGENKQFQITAKQWEFIPNTIEVNKGDSVTLIVRSIDVEHGILIPEFGVNERIIADNIVTIDFVADKAGTFDFVCNVQCGAGHSDMVGKLIVN